MNAKHDNIFLRSALSEDLVVTEVCMLSMMPSQIRIRRRTTRRTVGNLVRSFVVNVTHTLVQIFTRITSM